MKLEKIDLWIRISSYLKTLDPVPHKMDADPKHCSAHLLNGTVLDMRVEVVIGAGGEITGVGQRNPWRRCGATRSSLHR